jgi:uncharacterized membrane protein YdjX (TVP38/TMEM64 family)
MLKNLIRQNAATFVSMLLLVVLPVVVSSGLSLLLYTYSDLLLDLHLGEIIFYFGVVSFTMAFALTPTTYVALVTGFLLGWPSFPGVVVSYGLAAMLGYMVARIIDEGKLLAFLNRFEKTALVMEELRKQSWSLIILTRISPVLPFALMTFVLSVMKINRRKFLLASLIGMLPRTLFFFWVGTQAQSLITLLSDPDGGTGGQVLLVGLVVISLFGLYYLFNRALKRALRRASHRKK